MSKKVAPKPPDLFSTRSLLEMRSASKKSRHPNREPGRRHRQHTRRRIASPCPGRSTSPSSNLPPRRPPRAHPLPQPRSKRINALSPRKGCPETFSPEKTAACRGRRRQCRTRIRGRNPLITLRSSACWLPWSSNPVY